MGKEEIFNQEVSLKYQIYNSLFLTLPFEGVESSGMMLPLFSEFCKQGLSAKKSPKEIVDNFFKEKYPNFTEEEKIKLLIKFIQFVERQVALFDAIEDANFSQTRVIDGDGTLKSTFAQINASGKTDVLAREILDYKVRVVLTAHPTQFYPAMVLGIIRDLTEVIKKADLKKIYHYLLQMSKTPFSNHKKLSPIDEAKILLWYLENNFYSVLPDIEADILANIGKDVLDLSEPVVELGFWPGGDRDGNPSVTAAVTKEIAFMLKKSILTLYLKEVGVLMRRFTFKSVYETFMFIQQKLKTSLAMLDNKIVEQDEYYKSSHDLLTDILLIKEILIKKHQSLFQELLDNFILKIQSFGFYFASLDYRQDSRVHLKVLAEILTATVSSTPKELSQELYKELSIDKLSSFETLSVRDRTALLDKILEKIQEDSVWGELNFLCGDNLQQVTDVTRETMLSLMEAYKIQEENGFKGLHRYIISNTQSSADILIVLLLMQLVRLPVDVDNKFSRSSLNFDIVPLFETIDDLKNAPAIMEELYENKNYISYLRSKKMRQVVMVGFSDGTKDGGYVAANWEIFRAKEEISKIASRYEIDIVFFDGRGGPPARGGGNTHKFYRGMSKNIDNRQIQLTIQGQTISANFGTAETCRYNLEQLVSAGLEHRVFKKEKKDLSAEDKTFISDLASIGLKKYLAFKQHKLFLPYLEKKTPLHYYSMLKIGSRPARRNEKEDFRFEDLRAIPFVGAWSQVKQNVPGYFGLGTALKAFKEKGEFHIFQSLYKRSLFFKTLVENSMQSLAKSYFPLTFYLEEDENFGEFWKLIYWEACLTKQMLKEVSGFDILLQNDGVIRNSIFLRERTVLPLLVIQQYAMHMVDEVEENRKEIYQKIVLKTLAANINASRNSA